MGRIYENGVCNFAATAASHGKEHDGLFQESNPLRDANVRFRPPHSGGIVEDVASRALLMPSDRWNLDVASSPLNTRGWVFQERYLSPRTIHFASGELVWECRSNIAFESFSTTRSWELKDYPGGDLGLQPFKIRGRIAEGSQIEYFSYEGHWSDLVTEYSRSALTRKSDRLMALSGIARACYLKRREFIRNISEAKAGVTVEGTARRESSYLAGLWGEELPCNLCWAVKFTKEGQCKRADVYRGE